MIRRLTPLVVAASACSGEAAEDTQRRQDVIASLAQHVAVDAYTAFEDASREAASAAATLCEAPDADALQAARDAWWASRGPWKRTEIVNFGPRVEYPERLGPKLDDWPVNADAVEELVAADTPLDFSAMGSATRGLPVVEHLLWTAPGDDVLQALTEDARRCEVLAGAAADVHASAATMVTAWTDGWQDRLVHPGDHEDDDWSTAQDVLDEWVNRLGFTVENIRATKLGKPAGDDAGGELQLDTLESRASGRSLQDARDALAGARLAWDGPEGGDPGLRALAVDAPALVEHVDVAFDVAVERLDAVPETLEQTLPVEPEIVARAQEALQELQVAIQVDLSQALGVTVTFNDNDGD